MIQSGLVSVSSIPGYLRGFRKYLLDIHAFKSSGVSEDDYGDGRAELSNPCLSGIVLWHFSDTRTYGGGRSIKRPRTFNNKGIFEEYRRPKQAVVSFRDIFKHEFPETL